MHIIRSTPAWIFPLMLVAGCGGDYKTVSGTVTLDGDPLANCEVLFSPVEGGRPAMATTDENGHYQLASSMSQEGILSGSYAVHMTTEGEDEDENGRIVRTPETVPEAYRGANAPVVNVTDSGGEFDFHMKSGGS